MLRVDTDYTNDIFLKHAGNAYVAFPDVRKRGAAYISVTLTSIYVACNARLYNFLLADFILCNGIGLNLECLLRHIDCYTSITWKYFYIVQRRD